MSCGNGTGKSAGHVLGSPDAAGSGGTAGRIRSGVERRTAPALCGAILWMVVFAPALRGPQEDPPPEPGPPLTLPEKPYPGMELAFDPEGRTLAAGGFTRVRAWYLENGKESAPMTRHEGDIGFLAFSRDGKRLVSGDIFMTCKIYDIENAREVRALPINERIVSMALSPDAKTVAVGTSVGHLMLWSVEKGTRLWVAEHKRDLSPLAFNPKGTRLIAGTLRVAIWDTATGKKVASFSTKRKSGNTLAASAAPDFAVLYTSHLHMEEGETIRSEIRKWKLPDGKESKLFCTAEGMVNTLLAAPDGKLLASANDDGVLNLWDVATGKGPRTLTRAYVSSLTFSRDGKQLAAVAEGGKIQVWRLRK